MSVNHNYNLVNRSSSDNSAKTKKDTFDGEWIDFTQFTLMTGLSDVLNAFLNKKGKEIPVFGLTGLDVVSYALMVYLASLREGKYKERHKQLTEQNNETYYQDLAETLFGALTPQELMELNHDKPLEMRETDFIIELLKYNAFLIDPTNLPAARTKLDKWRAIFEKAKKRPGFVEARYHLEHKTFDEIELNKTHGILSQYSKKTKEEARHFRAKLKAIELSPDEESVFSKQLDLFEEYGVPHRNRHQARRDLKEFYDAYHALQDKNDKAFCKANMRGIQADEVFRTHFKTQLFGTVKNASYLGLACSVITFGTSVVLELLKKDPLPLPYLIGPLFLVGLTSLVDEASDLYFKNKKYWQSKEDLAQWKQANAPLMLLFPELLIPNSAAIKRFCLDPDNRPVIYSYYLGAKAEDEEYDSEKFGEKYLKAKYQEHKDLKDRLTRRSTKLFQAACSFTGVFFGVLISWVVSILAIAYALPKLETALSFAGFGTIGTAGFAGCVMVAYQKGQNDKKVVSAKNRVREEFVLLEKECPGLAYSL